MTLENAQSLSPVADYSSLSMYFFTSIGCCVCRKQATSPLSVQPTLSLDGITTLAFVPVITKHSELVLYGIPSTDDHKTHFPNAEAIRNFRIPKRRPLPPSATPVFSLLPRTQDSTDAVQSSCCVKRFCAGLSSNPYSLTFTVSTSQGQQWSNSSLEGKCVALFTTLCQLHVTVV